MAVKITSAAATPRRGGRRGNTVRVHPAEAMRMALGLHRAGHLDDAERIYRELLARGVRDANVLHFLGMLTYQRGRADEALALMRESLAMDAAMPDWHSNLGNVLLDAGQLDEAAEAYAQALALRPDHAPFLNNLGVLLHEQGRHEEAERAYLRAVALVPDYADAYTNCASLYMAVGRAPEGLQMFWQALLHAPRHARSRHLLGLALYHLGRLEEAAAVYRDWLKDEPDNVQARHHLAACSGVDVPGRAADGYVEKVFDEFASSFDAKLAMLHYRAPELVADQVAACLGEPRAALDVLDAGCGTGLCGPLLAPYARHLEGVDLSAGMLAKAEPRQVYHRLVKAELTAFLQQGEAESRDLIVSADTLCYFGRLAPVFEAAQPMLRPGGWLMFTLEAIDAALHPQGAGVDGFVLNPHGRYSHDAAAVRRDLESAGLEPVVFESVHLREESARPVLGWLVAARRR